MTDSPPIGSTALDSPQRVRRFITYFKNYMGLSTIVAAALPIPVTSFSLIPVYAGQKGLLGVYTSLFCFLTLAFIFYSRHSLGHAMFYWGDQGITTTRAARTRPLLCITAALAALVFYQAVLHESVAVARARLTARHILSNRNLAQLDEGSRHVAEDMLHRIADSDFWSLFQISRLAKHYLINSSTYQPDLKIVFSTTDEDEIPFGSALISSYLAMFIFAEASFVLMALREHLQDVIRIEDIVLLGWGAKAG